MSDQPKPFRLLRDTLLHKAGEIVHLLPDQVTEWHVPVASEAPQDWQSRMDALAAEVADLQARLTPVEVVVAALHGCANEPPAPEAAP